MNLRDLRYLVALAEHKHFGKAADACFVSQPTLSTQIKKLEELLDAQLIERGQRQFLLTDVGEQVVERARAILHEADAIRDIGRQAKQPEAGKLTLGVFPTLGPYWLPHVLPTVRERFPDLTLYLVEAQTDALLLRLEQGELDCAVLAGPIKDERFMVLPLFSERFVLAMHRGHALASGPAISSLRMIEENLLLLEEGHCLRAQALEFCALVGAQEQAEFRATSLETLRQMVASGVGITLLPWLSVVPPVARHPQLCLRRLEHPEPERDLVLVWRKSSARGPFLRKLASALVPTVALAEDPESAIDH